MKRTRIEPQTLGGHAISLLSGIRLRLMDNDDILSVFSNAEPGDKITPSTKRPIDIFPWIDMQHGMSNPQRMSDGPVLNNNERVNINIYCIGYDNCYIVGSAVSKWLLSAKDSIQVDDYLCTLYLAASNGPERQEGREAMAGEVWKWGQAYFAITGQDTF